jgi:hypothetical protein
MGHNGSTVLNMALNMSPQVVGVSQLNELLNPWDPYQIPEAARTATDRFWIDVLEEYSAEQREELRSTFASVNRERNLLPMLFSRRRRREFASVNSRLVHSVLRHADGQVLVDSSKNITRALALTASDDLDVYYLHLIRDVRGLVNSNNKRRAEEGLPRRFVRSTLHWFAKNVAASLVLPCLTSRRLRIRYEDIVTRPQATMDRLEAFLGESLGPTREALAGEVEIDSGTLGFGGNRVLKKKSQRFRTGVLPQDGIFRSRLYWYCLGWLAMFWGYRRRTGT